MQLGRIGGVAALACVACGRIGFAPVPEWLDARPDTSFDACLTSAGLVAYWPFDEGDGAVARDVSRNQLDSAVRSNAGWVAGRIGGALQFELDAEVTFSSSPALSFGGGRGSFSFSYWLSPTALTNPKIRPFEIAYCTGSAYILAYLDIDGTAAFGAYDASSNYAFTASVPGAVQIGRWTHVAHVLDRAAQQGLTYVDGVLSGPARSLAAWTQPIDCSQADLALYIGGWADFDYVGLLDDIRLYDRVLTSTEVADLAALSATGCPW